jgi:uncharacterized protein
MIMSDMKNNAVILFGRYPREGLVKTRLAATIGNKMATEFYRICLSNIFTETEKITHDHDIYFYFSDENDKADVQKIVPKSFKIAAQTGDTLPEKIDNAFAEVFNVGYKNVTIFSTDVPELNAKLISLASKELSSANCVIGPDYDDGYYCLGMDKYYPELLKVEYGGKGVGMQTQTINKAANAGLKLKTMPTVSDVDNITDLNAFRDNSPDLWKKHYQNLLC